MSAQELVELYAMLGRDVALHADAAGALDAVTNVAVQAVPPRGFWTPWAWRPAARACRLATPPREARTASMAPANIPEKPRDPADIALDRRIKGICKGCLR